MTQTEKLLLFPTLVKKHYNFLTSEECESITNFFENYPLEQDNPVFYGEAQSSYTTNIPAIDRLDVNIPSLKLKSRIRKILNEYGDDFGVDPKLIEVVKSWYNSQKRNSILINHNHHNTFLVGVIYLNVDDCSSPLVLENPNPYIRFKNFSFLKNLVNNKLDNFEFYSEFDKFFCIKPERGMLILYPGWINHGSHNFVNESDNRLILGFDTKFIDTLKEKEYNYEKHEPKKIV